MAAPFFSDIYKLFYYATKKDPISALSDEYEIEGVGVTQPDAMFDLRQSMMGGQQSPLRIRLGDSTDFIDLSTVTNRTSRYKEYERLESIPEIHTALNTFADEACVTGDTLVSTPFGPKRIAQLAKKDPTERYLVYCWDFSKNDYTLGWAYNARFVESAYDVVKVILDNGKHITCTPDHRVLLHSGEWKMAGDLKHGDRLKPFYRVRPNEHLTETRGKNFSRIYTVTDGWKHERQFIDEWRDGEKLPQYERLSRISRLVSQGLSTTRIQRVTKKWHHALQGHLRTEGFNFLELDWLNNKKLFSECRKVCGVIRYDGERSRKVYDLSVEEHENFATDSLIVHNCQTDDRGFIFTPQCENDEIKKELNFAIHRLWGLDDRAWSTTRNLCKFGDEFWEIIIDPHNPKKGVLKLQRLPADSMYRIETIKGKLVEFQQSKEGPDYQSLARVEITKANQTDLMQATALRFHPAQLLHGRLGEDRKQFYPYGVSMIEAARGPANQLRLMEDAMLVYRLCLVGNTRIKTSDGWKYIKDIKKNDIVWTMQKDNLQLKLSKVSHWINNGVQDVYEVKTKRTKITGTKTHPILVLRDKVVRYVDIQDLRPNEDQVVNYNLSEFDVEQPIRIPRIWNKWAKLTSEQHQQFFDTDYGWGNITKTIKKCGDNTIRIKQFLYKEGKSLPFNQAEIIANNFNLDSQKLIVCNKGEINPERLNVPEFVTEDFARLFGFLLGDGCYNNNHHGFNFSAGTNDEINKKYAKLMEKFFGHVVKHRDKRKVGPSSYRYIVNSTTAAKILSKLGFKDYCYNKRIPNWAFKSHKSIRIALIKGLSDADGHIRRLKSGLWTSEFGLCNKQLIEDIKELWTSCGFSSGNIRYRKRKGGHFIEKNRKMPDTECWELYISEKALPVFEPVQSITYKGREEVFDISIDDKNHNFVANSIIVHNTRAPERRIFYIDVGQLAPNRAEAFMERLKDQFRKKKVHSRKAGASGASSVEERWSPMAPDEDYWVPVRPNSNTRVETLPGAQNLSEVDDALYFRTRLFTALQFPKNYLTNEDPQATKLTLSQQDVRFARLVERIQKPIKAMVLELCRRHLLLRGYPDASFKDLEIKMTPPSDWRQINRNEVTEVLYGRAATLKGSQIMADFDILTRILGIEDDEAKEIVARNKAQKQEDMKLQVMGQNPELLGLTPMAEQGPQLGTTPGGPNPMLSPDQGGAPGAPGGAGGPGQETPGLEGLGIPPEGGPEGGQPPEGGEQPQTGEQPQAVGGEEAKKSVGKLPEPEKEDIRKYDMEISSYGKDVDHEEVDETEIEDDDL